MRHVLTLCALLMSAPAATPQTRIGDPFAIHCGAAPSAEETLRRLNAARARGAPCQGSAARWSDHAAPPLRWNTRLAETAIIQANDMAATQHMAHRDHWNRELSARLSDRGYRYTAAFENVAYGYASLDNVVDAWLASESHCSTLMNTEMLEVGVACSDAAAGEHGGTYRYWALVVGLPARSP